MEYIIDRFEGDFAICEDETNKIIYLLKTDLPHLAIEGSRIKKVNSHYILLDNSHDRERIKEKMNRLFKKPD
ncbi:MAG: DUF3006 domain-containing protein [Eubacteriaceae bacterium]